jgi:hypothetical protein
MFGNYPSMYPSSHRSYSDDPIAVTPEALSKIHSILTQNIGPVEIQAKCFDKTTRTFETIDSLLEYENHDPRRIVGMTMMASSQESKTRAEVGLADLFSQSWSLSVSGEDDFVTNLSDRLRETLRSIRPWFWRVGKIDLFLVVIIIFAALWLALVVLLSSGSIKFSEAKSTTNSPPAVFWLYFVAIVAGVFILNWIKKAAFPMTTFNLGAQAKKEDVREKVRWAVIVAPFVAYLGRALLP